MPDTRETSPAELRREAEILTRYLINGTPNPRETERYARASGGLVLQQSADRRAWRWMMAHPVLLPLFDAGLARLDPNSTVRHRILMMLAILEASPHHTEHFLARRFGWWSVLAMAADAAVGVLRVIAGVVLLKCMRLR